MNYWLCNGCAMNVTMSFMNVTCYIPECGGPGNYDPRLVAQLAKESKKEQDDFRQKDKGNGILVPFKKEELDHGS